MSAKKAVIRRAKYELGSLYNGDCMQVMKVLPDNHYTAIVSDPPYGLGFMGKDWDKNLPSKYIWKQAFRVLKPGGVMLIFGGTRMFHRLACQIEDAGFEIRDTICWMYGSGMPKSHNVSKAIDKKLGKKGIVVGKKKQTGAKFTKHAIAEFDNGGYNTPNREFEITKPESKEAKQFDGVGTALKPAWEPVIVAFKPTEGSYADNALKHGIAGINIDNARVGTNEDLARETGNASVFQSKGGLNDAALRKEAGLEQKGRWPANVILDKESALALDAETGHLKKGRATNGSRGWGVAGESAIPKWVSNGSEGYGDSGGASRFFYCSKASVSEKGDFNTHPTVKPVDLMKYLIKLVEMPKGKTRILEPFAGSGTTLVAAKQLKIKCDGIEINPEYCKIILKRLSKK